MALPDVTGRRSARVILDAVKADGEQVTTPRVRGWWWPPLAAVVLWTLPWPGGLVDVAYSRVAYRYLQTFLTTLSNLTPWTWFDVLVGVAAALVIRRAARLLQHRPGGWAGAGIEAAQRSARGAGVVGLAFLLTWGLNYRQTSMETALSPVPVPAPTVEAITSLMRDAGAVAARTRPAARRAMWSYEDVAEQLPGPLNAVLRALGRPSLAVPGRPKYTVFTPFFTRAGVNGMVDPFALESLVHPDLWPFERPFVLAHEWAHLAGVADEAEASAVGWAACMRGSDALAYSGALFLIEESAAALPGPVWRSVIASLDGGVRDDLMAIRERQRRIEPRVREVSFAVYDRYLKANQVPDGVASYSRALRIILLPAFRAHVIAGSPTPLR